MDQRMDKLDDEIKLIDCLNVISKWKKLIILGTIVIAIVAGVISFLMPKIYSIQMVLEPGILKVTGAGNNLYAESPETIKALIETGTFDRDILNSLKDNNKGYIPKSLHYKVTVPTGSNAIMISYQTSDIKLGVDILKKLGELLQNKHNQMGIRYKNELMIEIQAKKTEVSSLKVKKEAVKKIINNMDKRISDLLSELSDMKKYTKSLIKEGNEFFLKDINKEDVLSIILYNTIIQQNLAFTNTLSNTLEQLALKKDDKKIFLENLKNKIGKLGRELKNLEYRQKHIQNIQIIKPASSSQVLIKPKKKLIVVLGALLGLSSMLFLAFFLEYFFRYKERSSKVMSSKDQ